MRKFHLSSTQQLKIDGRSPQQIKRGLQMKYVESIQCYPVLNQLKMNGNLRKMKYQYLDTIIIRRRQLFILRTIGRTISGLSVGKIIIMILGFRVGTFRNIDHRGKKNLFSDWFACSKRKQFNKFLVTFLFHFFIICCQRI